VRTSASVVVAAEQRRVFDVTDPGRSPTLSRQVFCSIFSAMYAEVPSPAASGATCARKPVITRSRSSRSTRAYAVVREMWIRSARVRTEVRPSRTSSSRIRRSTASRGPADRPVGAVVSATGPVSWLTETPPSCHSSHVHRGS
jgi:hypothetical protein